MSEISNLTEALKHIPSTSTMTAIHCGITGTAFFPGGRGLWSDIDTTISNKKVLILGQDFDTLKNYEKSREKGNERVTTNPTWKNLIAFLKTVNISPDECFFTNALMGARNSDKTNSGKNPAWDDAEYIAACREYFLLQLSICRPELILVLGKMPSIFVSTLAPDLAIWEKERKFAQIDAACEYSRTDVLFTNGVKSNVVLLLHPSQRSLNIAHRSYNAGEHKGYSAEWAMVKEVWKKASSTTLPVHNDNDNFSYRLIKGRVAETLIQELFLKLDYNVFHYGMERSVPGITNLLKGITSPVSKEIRSMPDFIMQDKKGEVYFMEVKYRANETFAFNDLLEGYPWTNAYFIIVSKKHIKCLHYDDLKAGKTISPTSRNYLYQRKEFDLNKNIIIEYCQMAVKFFEGV